MKNTKQAESFQMIQDSQQPSTQMFLLGSQNSSVLGHAVLLKCDRASRPWVLSPRRSSPVTDHEQALQTHLLALASPGSELNFAPTVNLTRASRPPPKRPQKKPLQYEALVSPFPIANTPWKFHTMEELGRDGVVTNFPSTRENLRSRTHLLKAS